MKNTQYVDLHRTIAKSSFENSGTFVFGRDQELSKVAIHNKAPFIHLYTWKRRPTKERRYITLHTAILFVDSHGIASNAEEALPMLDHLLDLYDAYMERLMEFRLDGPYSIPFFQIEDEETEFKFNLTSSQLSGYIAHFKLSFLKPCNDLQLINAIQTYGRNNQKDTQ